MAAFVEKNEGDGESWKDAVREGCEHEFPATDRSLNLPAMGPAGDVEPIMQGHDQELQDDERGEGGL